MIVDKLFELLKVDSFARLRKLINLSYEFRLSLLESFGELFSGHFFI